jgi:hypothetical protein
VKYKPQVYALALGAIAAAVLALSLDTFWATLRADPRGVAIWFGLLAAAGVLTYVTLRGGGAVTGTVVVNFAIILTYGGEVAAWLAAAEMLLLAGALLRFSAVRTVFNVAQITVSVALAGLVYRALAGPSFAAAGGASALTPGLILPAVACHLTYFVANTGLVTLWSSLRSGRPALAAWRANCLWMLPQSFAAPVVGVALAYLYAGAAPWLVAALFLWLVYYARSSKTSLELRHSQRETVRALASIVDSSTPFLGGESEKVAALAVELGRKLGLAGRRLRALEYAALLHDIGYLAVGNRILSKGESLSPDEWASVKRHAETGALILGRMRGLKEASTLVLAHHERPDGRGYPRGLAPEAIPLEASVLKAADAFVAMTAERPYRPGMSAAGAVEAMAARVGTQFDREVVRALVDLARSHFLDDLGGREVVKAA